MTFEYQESESVPPASEIYQLKPDSGPKFIMVKRIFASYKFVEVDKETFLANYNSTFWSDFEWFGMVDDGIYEYISTLNTSYASKLIPFYRRIKGHQVKNYLRRLKRDHDQKGDTVTVNVGNEAFIDRVTEGREGTVLVMWKRRFMFSPNEPTNMAASVHSNFS